MKEIRASVAFIAPLTAKIITNIPAWIEVLINEFPHGIVKTETNENNECAALFYIPPTVASHARRLSIRIANSSHILCETSVPDDVPLSTPLIGEVYHDGGLIVSGWVIDPLRPDEHVTVIARLGKLVIATARAQKPSPRTCGNTGNHGFTIHLNTLSSLLSPQVVHLTDEKGRDIPGSPITIRPPVSLSAILRDVSNLTPAKLFLAQSIAKLYESQLPASVPFELIGDWMASFPPPQEASCSENVPFIRLDGRKLPAKKEYEGYDYVLISSGGKITFLTPAFGSLMLEHARKTEADILYSDSIGERPDTFFRPDWDPFLFDSFDYLGSVLLVRTRLLFGIKPSKSVEAFRNDLIRSADRIEHLPIPIYVERGITMPQPVSPDTPPHNNPHVTIIIPTRDRMDLLSTCISSILTKTNYPNYDIIIIDNNSQTEEMRNYLRSILSDRISVFSYPYDFNYAAMHNLVVPQAKGEFLLFLNNDIEIINPNWLDEMVSFTYIPDVAVVGAKLLWPNDFVQHGGVVIGTGGLAAHVGNTWRRDEPGYLQRNISVGQWSAVTGACMLIRKEDFFCIGGFDSDNFPVNFNDTDLCLRLKKKGKKILWTPYAELYHHESASRGNDVEQPWKRYRAAREQGNFRLRWGSYVDPFYNPNLTLSPFLAPFSALALPPRRY